MAAVEMVVGEETVEMDIRRPILPAAVSRSNLTRNGPTTKEEAAIKVALLPTAAGILITTTSRATKM